MLPVFCFTGYLLLGLIAMLVVLETFCELHELKKFRKMLKEHYFVWSSMGRKRKGSYWTPKQQVHILALV